MNSMEKSILKKLRAIKDKIAGKKIYFQLPEGLKYLIPKISEIFPRAVYSGENVYGACDVEKPEGYDIVVHIGHSPIPHLKYESTIFVEPEIVVGRDILSLATVVPEERIGLGATVEFLKNLKTLKEILEEYGKEVYIGKGDKRIAHTGQILGCNYSSLKEINEKVDSYIILSTGEFHPLGAYMATGKNVYNFNPIARKIEKIQNEGFLRKRFARIVKAEEAESFGVILCKKIGQRREELAKYIMELIESASFKAYLVEMDEITPYKLMNLPADVVVNTACPRITYDEEFEKKSSKIIISPQELEIALKVRRWDEYEIDEITPY